MYLFFMKKITSYYNLWLSRFNFKNQRKIVNEEELKSFIKKGLDSINYYISKSDYKSQKNLPVEVEFLINTTCSIIRDDVELGDGVLYCRLPHINDYVFSNYRKISNLKDNINKLIILSLNNRFDEDPRKNLLSYYVFLEEIGFEIIIFLNDYYDLLLEKPSKTFEEALNIFQPQTPLDELMAELREENINLTPLGIYKEIVSNNLLKENLFERKD